MERLNTEFGWILLILVTLVNFSCKTQKPTSGKGFQNSFFGIEALACDETVNPDAIDSKVGTLDCKNISFNYDYGKFSNPGPITPKEEFRRTFDNYHHLRFFEYRMIDKKVYKLFLDSVDVVEVRPKRADDTPFFECKTCNIMAEITFKGDTYFFPVTLSEKQLDQSDYSVSFKEKGANVHKYYQQNNRPTGLYITPKFNRFKKKNTLSLTVKETTLSTEEVERILDSVYLVKEKAK